VSRLESIWPQLLTLQGRVREAVETEALYAVYLDRQQAEIDRSQQDRGLIIPADLDFYRINGLSGELKVKLAQIRPVTLDHASRIEGMTPAGLALIAAQVKRATVVPDELNMWFGRQ